MENIREIANLFLFQTKDALDRDMVLPHLGKSEKGMVNTEYKRYLARIPKTYAITKLGYSTDVFDLEPVMASSNIEANYAVTLKWKKSETKE